MSAVVIVDDNPLDLIVTSVVVIAEQVVFAYSHHKIGVQLTLDTMSCRKDPSLTNDDAPALTRQDRQRPEEREKKRSID